MFFLVYFIKIFKYFTAKRYVFYDLQVDIFRMILKGLLLAKNVSLSNMTLSCR